MKGAYDYLASKVMGRISEICDHRTILERSGLANGIRGNESLEISLTSEQLRIQEEKWSKDQRERGKGLSVSI
jgi:hypothetical protein